MQVNQPKSNNAHGWIEHYKKGVLVSIGKKLM